MSSDAVGTGNRPATMASLNAQRDAEAAAAAAAGGAEPPRDWSQGGRLKYTISKWPLGTLLLVLANIAVYCYELSDDSSLYNNAICVEPVLEGHEFLRVISNAFFHSGVFHIGMNLLALFSIGAQIEEKMGTIVILGQAILFTPLIGLQYIVFEYLAAVVTHQAKYLYTCAVGFSGVIFAFLVVSVGLQMRDGETHRRLGPINVPLFLYPLVALAGISLIMPGISFAGHLSGIVIGLFYVRGLLLPLSLPYTWLLGIQSCLPGFLTRRQGWKNMPESSPFEPWHPACIRSFRCGHCPDPPEIGSGVGCLQVLSLVMMFCQGIGRGYRRHRDRGQVSGYANAAPVSDQQQAQQPPGAPAGVSIASPSRSSSLLNPLDPPSRAFPGMPAVDPSALGSSADSRAESRSSGNGQGQVRGFGSPAGGGVYSRLDDDDAVDVEMQSMAASAPAPAVRGLQADASRIVPPRSVSLSPSAPLLHPSEDPDLELARQHQRVPDL